MIKDKHATRTTYLEQHGLPATLAASVTSLTGVNRRRSEQLAKLGIYSILDLLRYFPRRYEIWQTHHNIANITANDNIAVLIGELISPLQVHYKGRLSYIRSQINDGTGIIDVIWFNQPWLGKQLRLHTPYVFRGKIKANNYSLCLQNPRVKAHSVEKSPNELETVQVATLKEIEKARFQDEKKQLESLPQLIMADSLIDHTSGTPLDLTATTSVANQPIYSLTANLTNVNMQTLQTKALSTALAVMPEILPTDIRSKYSLVDSQFAYEQIHFPRDQKSLTLAKRRLAFEELFLLQLGLKTLRMNVASKQAEQVLLSEAAKNTLSLFEKSLPFTLTAGQIAAKTTIIASLAEKIAENRLLQGDVGSGKTVVAAYAMLACYLAHKQAVLMAPTQILAKQHYATLLKLWGDFVPFEKVMLVTSNLTAKERKEIARKISNNEISLVVGTHAVLNENWQWPALALAITDEQHRFGVNQRLSFLHDKQLYPHLLVMSATPIPRSLALVLYGDLQVSIIADKPAKRKPILTYMANKMKMPKIYEYVQAMVARGKQVYWICPLVSPEETQADDVAFSPQTGTSPTDKNSNLMAAITRQATLQEYFPNLQIGLVHGKLKETDKNAVMQDFYAGKINVLVATTVVEVGVDNPNADLIIVENAERFGLAQLHQLRGRVGRGQGQAVCILLSEQATLQAKQANSRAYQRLETLCKSEDGFYLANEDLKLRGPGDFFGVRQHGLPDFKLVNLYEDKALIAETQEAVNDLLQKDGQLQQAANKYLKAAIAWYYPDLENNVVL